MKQMEIKKLEQKLKIEREKYEKGSCKDVATAIMVDGFSNKWFIAVYTVVGFCTLGISVLLHVCVASVTSIVESIIDNVRLRKIKKLEDKIKKLKPANNLTKQNENQTGVGNGVENVTTKEKQKNTVNLVERAFKQLEDEKQTGVGNGTETIGTSKYEPGKIEEEQTGLGNGV